MIKKNGKNFGVFFNGNKNECIKSRFFSITQTQTHTHINRCNDDKMPIISDRFLFSLVDMCLCVYI